jgi:hypothetical protein
VAALLLALAAPAAGAAQPVVTSPAPEAVSVTVYRNPQRAPGREMELGWLGGYALISETRTVTLPAGESTIRFEGVAGGILPVSAVVSGLPSGLSERNHDARLLSPGALIDASLGRQVHIRRTNRATGRVTESEAIIRSGPDGIVLQTSEGFEALRCSGLPESLIYREVPPGLSDKPTLAVRTSADAPATVTVQLSYLAGQFDWEANYVAHLAPDGRTLDLFAWLTLANGNGESFGTAHTQAVAGTINREEQGSDSGARPVSPEIRLRCWPRGTTSDVPHSVPPIPGELDDYEMTGGDIVVTGARIRRANLESSMPVTAMSAEQEELGDLKLYRVPEPVTVAANGQKQVALLSKARVPVERIHGISVNAASQTVEEDGEGQSPKPVGVLLRMKNTKAKGLGLALPAGKVAMFEVAGGRQMLVGEAPVGDTAVGEDVEFEVGESFDLSYTQARLPLRGKLRGADAVEAIEREDEDDRPRRYEIELRNARPTPATVETVLWTWEDYRVAKPSRKLGIKNGGQLWRARVPANGRVKLVYLVERIPEPRSGRRVTEEPEAEDAE